VEYRDRKSVCSEVADVLVVLGGGERPLHGKGGHGRVHLQRKLVPDTQDRSTQANLTADKATQESVSPVTAASPTEEGSRKHENAHLMGLLMFVSVIFNILQYLKMPYL